MAILSSNTMKESGGESERKDKLLRGQYVGCHTFGSKVVHFVEHSIHDLHCASPPMNSQVVVLTADDYLTEGERARRWLYKHGHLSTSNSVFTTAPWSAEYTLVCDPAKYPNRHITISACGYPTEDAMLSEIVSRAKSYLKENSSEPHRHPNWCDDYDR